MSTTVRQYGFIAVLTRPLSKEEREDIQEMLWEKDSKLGVSDDGKLVYFDQNSNESIDVREDIYGLFFGHDVSMRELMEAELLKYNLMIDGHTMRPYNCVYYNGGDSPLWMLSKEEFLRKTGQI